MALLRDKVCQSLPSKGGREQSENMRKQSEQSEKAKTTQRSQQSLPILWPHFGLHSLDGTHRLATLLKGNHATLFHEDSLYQDHQRSLRCCCDRTSVLCCPSCSCSSRLLFFNRLELSDHVHRALATKKKRNCGILTDTFRTIRSFFIFRHLHSCLKLPQ